MIIGNIFIMCRQTFLTPKICAHIWHTLCTCRSCDIVYILCLENQNFRPSTIGYLSNSCTSCYASAAGCDWMPYQGLIAWVALFLQSVLSSSVDTMLAVVCLFCSDGDWRETCRNASDFNGRTSWWQLLHSQICRSLPHRGFYWLVTVH